MEGKIFYEVLYDWNLDKVEQNEDWIHFYETMTNQYNFDVKKSHDNHQGMFWFYKTLFHRFDDVETLLRKYHGKFFSSTEDLQILFIVRLNRIFLVLVSFESNKLVSHLLKFYQIFPIFSMKTIIVEEYIYEEPSYEKYSIIETSQLYYESYIDLPSIIRISKTEFYFGHYLITSELANQEKRFNRQYCKLVMSSRWFITKLPINYLTSSRIDYLNAVKEKMKDFDVFHTERRRDGHIVTIFADYTCDEDKAIYNDKLETIEKYREYSSIIDKVFGSIEDAGDFYHAPSRHTILPISQEEQDQAQEDCDEFQDFYLYYIHANTSHDISEFEKDLPQFIF